MCISTVLAHKQFKHHTSCQPSKIGNPCPNKLENVTMKIHLHGLQVFKKASKKIFLYNNNQNNQY